MMKITPCLSLALLVNGLPLAFAQEGTNRLITQAGTSTPGVAETFSSFSDVVLNGSGVVAFLAYTSSGEAIYTSSSTGINLIASMSQAAPTIAGTFTNFSTPVINDSGRIAFFAQNNLGGQALYTTTGGVLTTISATTQSGPGLTGNIATFPSAFALSDNGSVAFRADTLLSAMSGLYIGSGGTLATIANTTQTVPTTGGNFAILGAPVLNNVGVSAVWEQNSSGQGIYMNLGSTLMPVVTTTHAMPELGVNFLGFSIYPALNDGGNVAFKGFGAAGRKGIYVGAGGVLTTIANTTRLAPGLSANFNNFSDPSLSNTGFAAFIGYATTGQGIYLGNGSALQPVAVSGQAAPGVGGSFSSFGKPSVNDLGTTAFVGMNANGTRGLYLGDSQQIVTAAFSGQALSGSTITDVLFTGGVDRGGSSQLNNNGQLAYQAVMADGTTKLLLFTPALHFRNPASGTWATRSNWTVGLQPGAVHDVVIDPTASLAVTGPTLPTTVKSLTLNGLGGGIAELALQNGAITAVEGVTNGLAGRVTGNGKFVGNLTNAGVIAPGRGTVTGAVNVTGNVVLQATSQITLEIGGVLRKTTYDCFATTGALTLGGTLDVSLLGGFVPQLGHTFDLFDSASTVGSFSAIRLPSLASGLLWETALLPTTGVLSVGTAFKTWNLAGGGSWATPGNWLAGVPNAAGAVATFGSAAGGNPAVVNVSGPKTVGSIVFDSVTSFQVNGSAADAITLAHGSANPTIRSVAGHHGIAAPLLLTQATEASAATGTDLTLAGQISGAVTLDTTGAGTVNLNGPQAYATLHTLAGLTNLNGSFTGGTATVNAGATTHINSAQKLASLQIANGAVVTFGAGPGAPSLAAFDSGAKLESAPLVAAPEPGSLGLLSLGALGILARRRRIAA